MFGIYYEEKHIGNIKLGPIKWAHKSADVSYFIGNKEYWDKGIATSVVSKVLDFGVKDLDLEKINAGYTERNLGSAKVLKKCGFEIEGKLLRNSILEGERVNDILVGYVKKF